MLETLLSSVSDCVRTVDWGPHSLAHRSACVVAVTGLPPPLPPSLASTSHMKWARPLLASCVQNARGRRVYR